MYELQYGIAPGIMNDIFRKRNITYSTRISSGFETRNIKTSLWINNCIFKPKDMVSCSTESKRFRQNQINSNKL